MLDHTNQRLPYSVLIIHCRICRGIDVGLVLLLRHRIALHEANLQQRALGKIVFRNQLVVVQQRVREEQSPAQDGLDGRE